MTPHSTNLDKPVGPNVARAWFDTVFRPLMIGLEEECRRLRERKWGWEPAPESLECARPARRYLDYQAWKNLEQVFDSYPDILAMCDAHDQALERLTSAFEAAQRIVENSEELQAVVTEVVNSAEADLTTLPQHYLGDERKLQSYLAAYIVNGYEDLHSHYVLAPLWNRHAARFLKLRKASSFQAEIETIQDRSDELLECSRQLYDKLDSLWRELSRRLDVPFYERPTPAEWRT